MKASPLGFVHRLADGMPFKKLKRTCDIVEQ
jgi:hypothetical protein